VSTVLSHPNDRLVDRRAVRAPWLARVGGLLAILVLATGCAREAPAGRPGVLVVVLDAAGARHVGAYGNDRPTTPRIDALAGEGTLFERAYAQASWTLPSIAALLTGRYPPWKRQDLMTAGDDTVATRLHAAGVATAGFSENPLVTHDLGFAAGFDAFHEYFPKRLFDENPRSYPRVASETTVDDAIEWLRAHRADPFFLYIHLLPPHCPYPAPQPFGGRFDPDYAGNVHGLPDTLLRINEGRLAITARDLEHLTLEYQENLAFGDYQVGRLLDALDTLGLRRRTLVVATADHGEAMREHGTMLHTTSLYDEPLHVPLLVRFPHGVVELRQVRATIERSFGLAGPGHDLLEMVRQPPDPDAVARSWTADAEHTLGAITTAQHKLVLDRRTRRLELYDLAHDPGETRNLAALQRPLAVRLVRQLRRREGVALHRRERPLERETVERLHALGYVDTE
jgi:arylsulfatase A-like enzyme